MIKLVKILGNKLGKSCVTLATVHTHTHTHTHTRYSILNENCKNLAQNFFILLSLFIVKHTIKYY